MTTQIISDKAIRAHLLKVLSGYSMRERKTNNPKVRILSPWISDVQLELDPEVFKLDDIWFGLDYGIHSINLSYSLLLLKLTMGANIDIVTLPPTRENYGDSAYFHQQLLDFLDEIGCNIYINSKLHSKLVLSNDSALIGSFNLSKAALYDREEVGISLDDIGNLRCLDEYSQRVIDSSVIYGYSANQVKIGEFYRPIYERASLPVTRGKLYEIILSAFYNHGNLDPYDYSMFIHDVMEVEGNYLKYVIQRIALDLEGFYINGLLTYLTDNSLHNQDTKMKVESLNKTINYRGIYQVDKIMAYVQTILARPHIPKIDLKLTTMPKEFEDQTLD